MKTYKCKLKSRKQMEKEISRDKWGWWIDICPGKTLELREATQDDLNRCILDNFENPKPEQFMCEIPKRGSLVNKEAIEFIQMSVEEIT